MTIDWITVSAQIVNFLILVWLLKRFLYQPVINAMDRREQRIAERLEDAQQREQQAEDESRSYQQKRDELEQQREQLINDAKNEAEQKKKELLDSARDEVAETQSHWRQQADQERNEFMRNLRRRSAEAFEAIAHKALSDLADTELEAHIVHVFLERFKSLDKKQLKEMANETVHISSAFELDSNARSRVTRAVHELIDDEIEVSYSQTPELLCGIELSAGGRQLSWNLSDYMEALNENINDAFNAAKP